MALPAVIEPCLPSPGEQPPTGPNWIHEIKHDGYRLMARRDALSVGIRLLTRNGHQGGVSWFSNCRPKMEKRPTLRPAGLLLFARFRWREQPTRRGTIKLALFLPSARPTFWGTPNNPRLPKKMGAVRLNPLRDVALHFGR